MCGIAGLIDWKQHPPEEALRAMEKSLYHRGPDEGGIWRSGPCGLVHRRLRIIDLSPAAAQPMSNEDGSLWLVFNGEIYNFQALRTELQKEGHCFRSRSDTEVIVHGYETWGLSLFGKLRGMFAIALWDTKEGRLVLARDRLGKKPLFYSTGSSWWALGSELSIFKHVPQFRPQISAAALSEYVEWGYVPAPNTILEDVYRLMPGHYLVADRSGVKQKAFWQLPTEPAFENGNDPDRAAAALEEPLRQAVASRLVSDVPLGCFLSGGVDSSLIAALAQESTIGKLKTYTVGFEDSLQNEAAHARLVARHLGTDHHEIALRAETVFPEFESILSQTSEPLGDDSFIPTFLISRATRQHVTVALTGDGGDELFCGYKKYGWFRAAQRFPSWLPYEWLARLPVGDPIVKAAEALSQRNPEAMARWLSTVWKKSEIQQVLVSPRLNERDFFAERWQARSSFPVLERWMLVDSETYLEGDILPKVDRASMAVALEARSPFLDHLFVGEALRWKCRASPGNGGKKILKQILAKRLPPEIFERPKQGFGIPIEQWYRGPLRKLLLHFLSRERLEARGLFRPEFIQPMIDAHLSGDRNYGRRLHLIIAFEVWADGFFGRASG